jgi:hypothetical protein
MRALPGKDYASMGYGVLCSAEKVRKYRVSRRADGCSGEVVGDKFADKLQVSQAMLIIRVGA